MITTLEPFGDITTGISISGFQNYVILNNTIGNAYKSIVLCHLTHSLIEDNYIFTNGSTEGEIQIEHSDYIAIRKNMLINQWDSIEIYNSRHLLIERNHIKDGVTGIRVEREDEYGGIDPINVTIRYNVLVNSGFISTTKARSVKIVNNLLNSTDIVLMNSENLLIYNNTIYNGTIGITDSKDIIITDNYIEPPSGYPPVQLENCQNVTQTNNIAEEIGISEEETSENRFQSPLPHIFGIRMDFLTCVFVITVIIIVFLFKRKPRRKLR
ncbi:MAG: right-handed parallel beta-helix repeat-containing protein [Candidatus Baldrarchaeia archaeon]